jgi:crotonobetainyl-CoA:carnitine CoA-transferase CaiB-like acyl-CoA transferase
VAPIPDKGEHTDDILSEAGFDHETIAKLKAERVV